VLSYFNRVFRRQFGATPSAVREAARRGGGGGASDQAVAAGEAECGAAGR